LQLPITTTNPVINPGSRFVSYGAQNNEAYLYDLLTRTNRLLCTSCLNPSISADGRWLAFETRPNSNGFKNLVLNDLQTGITNLITTNRLNGAVANGSSFSPLISYDGRYIAFLSTATDLVDNDTNNWTDLFVRDRVAGTTLIASMSGVGAADGLAYNP